MWRKLLPRAFSLAWREATTLSSLVAKAPSCATNVGNPQRHVCLDRSTKSQRSERRADSCRAVWFADGQLWMNRLMPMSLSFWDVSSAQLTTDIGDAGCKSCDALLGMGPRLHGTGAGVLSLNFLNLFPLFCLPRRPAPFDIIICMYQVYLASGYPAPRAPWGG